MIKITDENRKEMIEKCLIDAANTLNISYDEVLEEAVQRKNALNNALAETKQIKIHIIKLFIRRTEIDLNGWVKELCDKFIFNFIKKLSKSKYNLLKDRTVLSTALNVNENYTNYATWCKQRLSDLLIKENVNISPYNINLENLYYFTKDIILWLIPHIQNLNLKKGFENDDCVRPEEFKPFVEKLYTKYRLEK